jgi:hypothetical protein
MISIRPQLSNHPSIITGDMTTNIVSRGVSGSVITGDTTTNIVSRGVSGGMIPRVLSLAIVRKPGQSEGTIP